MMGFRSSFSEACAAGRRRVEQWAGAAPRYAAEAAWSVARSYHHDAARWCARTMQEEMDVAHGIFGGANALGIVDVNNPHASAAFEEYTAERKLLTVDGLVVLFSCPRCGEPRKLAVDWLELAAIAVDAPPQAIPERLLAAWKLEEPTVWCRRDDYGDWTPDGCPCSRCGVMGGTYTYEQLGRVSERFYGGLPFIHPAEVRAMLFAALNERKLPTWFVPAMAVYLAVKRPYAARVRLRKVVERVRDGRGSIPQFLDEMRQWLGLWWTPAAAPSGSSTPPEPAGPSSGPWKVWLEFPARGRPGYVRDVWCTKHMNRYDAIWRKAGCFAALYDGDGTVAGELVGVLSRAVAAICADPDGYRALPGAGDLYDKAMRELEHLLTACKSHPGAILGVWHQGTREDEQD